MTTTNDEMLKTAALNDIGRAKAAIRVLLARVEHSRNHADWIGDDAQRRRVYLQCTEDVLFFWLRNLDKAARGVVTGQVYTGY
jgi:hypothetical protein